MMRRILCLHLPDWPIQRLRAARESQKSEIRSRKSENGSVANDSAFRAPHLALPIILHNRDPRRGDVVVVCDAAAYERGVRLDMPLAEAAALAEHGGECLILPHDPAADLTELARLAEHCERFSPIVGWKTADGVRNAECGVRSVGSDCLFFDVTGIGVLFGGEEQLGREVVADLKGLGYEARVATADTIGAAWALTKQQELPDVQVLSTEYSVLNTKSSADQPTGNALPSFRTSHSALRTLPIHALRLSSETIDLLSQLGVVRLEQLLELPRESLRARFGELLALRIDQLLGTAQEVIVPHRPPPQFVSEWLLEYPAERRELVEQILRELVHRIATALANRREGVLKLECRLDCAPGRPVLLEVGLFRPSADKDHLFDLLQMQLERAALPGPVGRARLEAALTAPLENRQGELFAGGEHEAERQFALLIDRCSSRLGTNAVLRPQLTADPLPERAVRYKTGVRSQRSGVRGRKSEVRGQDSKYSVLSTKYAVRSKKARHKTDQTASDSALRTSHSALLRPLLLHSPPQAMEVLSIAPDGPPVSFRLQGKTHEIADSSGPERIETGWWRGRSVRRDYWRVETTAGQRFWLFRQLANGQWFLHGEYA